MGNFFADNPQVLPQLISGAFALLEQLLVMLLAQHPQGAAIAPHVNGIVERMGAIRSILDNPLSGAHDPFVDKPSRG